MGLTDAVNAKPSSFNPDQRYCIVCEKKLSPARLVWCSDDCYEELRKMLRSSRPSAAT